MAGAYHDITACHLIFYRAMAFLQPLQHHPERQKGAKQGLMQTADREVRQMFRLPLLQQQEQPI